MPVFTLIGQRVPNLAKGALRRAICLTEVGRPIDSEDSQGPRQLLFPRRSVRSLAHPLIMRTLHGYFFRELLKTFGMTALALTLLVVMGGGVANIFKTQGVG